MSLTSGEIIAAGLGAIPHPAVSFYTCPINILVNFVPRKRFIWYKVRTIALLLSEISLLYSDFYDALSLSDTRHRSRQLAGLRQLLRILLYLLAVIFSNQ